MCFISYQFNQTSGRSANILDTLEKVFPAYLFRLDEFLFSCEDSDPIPSGNGGTTCDSSVWLILQFTSYAVFFS